MPPSFSVPSSFFTTMLDILLSPTIIYSISTEDCVSSIKVVPTEWFVDKFHEVKVGYNGKYECYEVTRIFY